MDKQAAVLYPADKAVNSKISNVHKLDRKHSSGDLLSRLKTRKLLGVGGTDDGDVHRSKLSQILGHSEQLYIRLPRGLRIWQFIIATTFSLTALWALVVPVSLFSFALNDATHTDVVLPIRLYGAVVLGLSVLLWQSFYSIDKDVIKWSLLATVLNLLIQILVLSVTLIERGTFLQYGPVTLLHRCVYVAVSYFYSTLITDKLHKSASQS